MIVVLASVFLLVATFISGSAAAGSDYYRAAVVDYQHLQNDSLSAHENLMINVKQYGELIQYANKNKADIIVFPESGLLGLDFTIFLTIPDPNEKIVPANNPAYDESIQQLSESAKNKSLYVAVNLHENYTDPKSNKMFKYNTNVVFDRNGAVVARYRKFNLFDEPLLDRPEKPEYSYFDSDFGVRFGQFVCFDIMFKEPALTLIKDYNVTHFIYPSEWFSALPFVTSVQVQWMWSVGNNVKLLAAGLNRPSAGSGGSGIYEGKTDLNLQYGINFYEGEEVLIEDVPKDRNIKEGSGEPRSSSTTITGEANLNMFSQTDIINEMTHEDVTSSEFNKKICHNKLCCTFDLRTSTSFSALSFRSVHKAIVFDGQVHVPMVNRTLGFQICGIILCLNSSLSSCGFPAAQVAFTPLNIRQLSVTFSSINITGNFIKKDANVLPNILLWRRYHGQFLLNPRDMTFKTDGEDGSTNLSLKPNKQFITCAIHSRVFSRDTN